MSTEQIEPQQTTTRKTSVELVYNSQDINDPIYTISSQNRSFSLKRMASKAMIYDIPEDVEHTKLKDGFQCGYVNCFYPII